MRALTWQGVGVLRVAEVPEPEIRNAGDAIVRVRASSVCGADVHLIDGHVTAMRAGDVLGHEFVGEIVAVGDDVHRHKVGDRVVVGSVIGCGRCHFCTTGQWSLCDNSNPHPETLDHDYGHATAGMFGYSDTFGGFAGSHAELVRVPYADYGAFAVPDRIRDDAAVFASDAVPTGWMAADLCDIAPGDTVAVWGAGAVGQMAARAAYLLGADQVVVVDRVPERLALAEKHVGVTPLNVEEVDVQEALRELTSGRGPDCCIEAVGMAADALREAILACRKGGTVSVVGTFLGAVDALPMGAAMNKALSLRMGQQHGQRYIPMILKRIARGDIDPRYLLTHPMPLEDAPRGYELFRTRGDGCLRAVFTP